MSDRECYAAWAITGRGCDISLARPITAAPATPTTRLKPDKHVDEAWISSTTPHRDAPSLCDLASSALTRSLGLPLHGASAAWPQPPAALDTPGTFPESRMEEFDTEHMAQNVLKYRTLPWSVQNTYLIAHPLPPLTTPPHR